MKPVILNPPKLALKTLVQYAWKYSRIARKFSSTSLVITFAVKFALSK